MLNQRIDYFKYGREEMKNKQSAAITPTGIQNVTPTINCKNQLLRCGVC